MELMDKEGTQIQATFFNEAVTKFGDIIEENKVYLFCNGNVKIANKKFTSCKNDYCLNFDANAEVTEAADDKMIKNVGFSFINIQSMTELVQQQQVDVIGIITEVGSISQVNIKGNPEKKILQSIKDKRSITIADDSNSTI